MPVSKNRKHQSPIGISNSNINSRNQGLANGEERGAQSRAPKLNFYGRFLRYCFYGFWGVPDYCFVPGADHALHGPVRN